ncbi:MAG: tetraacyldisaccharide 4'-kinase [Lutibacter sp.]|uniref:tetraacyldisaccharide 4'-kinase n=1 Tax=Lutibacter sp. TaxID=1925666 RepID=UPI0019D8F1AF|nr:tetraacyldisaccharide 4'-kinase [Lutibacter sp.]NOR27143.1 tetraacyldisaccharide 4'-kinase [Lutibacter sp.]
MNFFRKILFPFSLLYGLITSVRNYLYQINVFKSTKFKVPTIVVGNLSVGGTGKTPQIEYLIRLLQNNYKIAVLSRGYKRKSKGFIIADENSSSEVIGDEPFQYYKKFPNIIVCVDADRTNAIQKLETLENPPDIVLLDDAFQHRKVQGGFNILLTSFSDLYVDDVLLPTGNLRESKSGAKRAQVIIVTKCPSTISEAEQLEIINRLKPSLNQQVFFTAIEYDNELKGSSTLNLLELVNKKIILITGIANPAPLTDYLKSLNIKFKHLKYPDHYNFKKHEVEKINALTLDNNNCVITTEKDYVRIFVGLQNLRYISIQTKFVAKSTSFDKLINKYVE